MPTETTSAADQKRKQASLKGYGVAVIVLAFLGLYSTSSLTSVSQLNDLRVVQSQWNSPRSPHRASALPPYMRPTNPEANLSETHDDYDPDLNFDPAHLPLSFSSQSSSSMFSHFFSQPEIYPPSQNVSQFQKPLPMLCTHSAILTVVADLPPIVRQLASLPDWCIFLSVPLLQMYPENHPYVQHLGLPDDIVTAKNIVVLNASFIASLPYDTAKQYASRSNPNSYANNSFSSEARADSPENETSSRSQDHQQAMSSRAVAQDTSALITVHNIAYLLAVHQGSQDILEVWPDVQIASALNMTHFVTLSNETRIPLAHSSHLWFNPHPHFGPHSMHSMQSRPHSWPRGFPLRQTWDNAATSTGVSLDSSKRKMTSAPTVEDKDVGIITALVDVSPDVDATLSVATDQLPLIFRQRSDVDIALPLGRFAPLSSACTLWRSSAFPLLFLPPRAPVRMIDVFRGLVAQRAMHASGQHIVYRAPVGVRMYLDARPRMDNQDLDYDSRMSAALDDMLPYLRSWEPHDNSTLAQYSFDLLRTLSHSNIVGDQDVSAAAEWLNDLRRVMSSNEAFTVPLDEAGFQEAERAKYANYSQYHATRDSAISRGPNVAICVAGDIEVLQRHLTNGNLTSTELMGRPSINSYVLAQNMTVGHALWHNLITKLPSPDVFVLPNNNDTSSRSKSNNSMSGCDLLYPQYVMTSTCTQWVSEENESDWPAIVWKRLMATSRKFYDSTAQLRSRHACKSAIDKAVRQSERPAYDWMIYVDAGTLVDSLPRLESLILDQRDDNGVVWTSSQDDFANKNDSQLFEASICTQLKLKPAKATIDGLFMGHWKPMSTWLNALELLVVAHNTSDNGFDSSDNGSLQDALAHNGVTVKTHPMLFTCRVTN